MSLEAGKRISERCTSLSANLLQVSGRALYSPNETLSSGSKYYFLGSFPGVTPDGKEWHDELTVVTDLERMSNGSGTSHALFDEKWYEKHLGSSHIQKRGKMLFDLLVGGNHAAGELLLRRTPTSNFILRRAKDATALKRESGMSLAALAKAYWPFHEAVIEETQCKFVISHAITPARCLAAEFKWTPLGSPELDDESRKQGKHDSGWGGTLAYCYAWKITKGPILIALPSFSRYSPDGPRATALKRMFDQLNTWN